MSDTVIKNMKAQRVAIDAVIQSGLALKEDTLGAAGRELSISYTKLQEAKMWIGKALEAAGHELPAYYQDKAKSAEVAEDEPLEDIPF